LDSIVPPEVRSFAAVQLISMRPGNMALVALAENGCGFEQGLLFTADSYSRAHTLHLYYYSLSLQFFQRLIVRKNISNNLLMAAKAWWKSRGRTVYEFVIKESERTNTPLNESVEWLAAHYRVDGSNADGNLVFSSPLVDLSTLRAVTTIGKVALYGAGDVAPIVDAAPEKHGMSLGGLTVQSPDILGQLDVPVLICSQAFLPEIYVRLRHQLGAQRQFYAICCDELIRRFLLTL